jgi:histone H3/H4
MSEEGQDILVVVSKLKKYIREKSGMNTSSAVAEVLTAKLQAMCDQAIETAKNDGRKTVMDRDFG